MAGPRQGKRTKGDAKGARILIVEARFYDDIADALLAGAMKALKEANATVDCISVPGSLEIPPAIAIALDAARRKRRAYDAAVGLGCVIRGDTFHFEVVATESARGISRVALEHGVPVANAVLTTDNEAQARERIDEKGREAARVAVEMANLMWSLEDGGEDDGAQ